MEWDEKLCCSNACGWGLWPDATVQHLQNYAPSHPTNNGTPSHKELLHDSQMIVFLFSLLKTFSLLVQVSFSISLTLPSDSLSLSFFPLSPPYACAESLSGTFTLFYHLCSNQQSVEAQWLTSPLTLKTLRNDHVLFRTHSSFSVPFLLHPLIVGAWTWRQSGRTTSLCIWFFYCSLPC